MRVMMPRCVCGGPKNSFQKSVPSFLLVVPGPQTHIVQLGGKCLYCWAISSGPPLSW